MVIAISCGLQQIVYSKLQSSDLKHKMNISINEPQRQETGSNAKLVKNCPNKGTIQFITLAPNCTVTPPATPAELVGHHQADLQL